MSILERVVVPEGLMIGNASQNKPVRKSTKIIVSALCICLLLASIGSSFAKSSHKEALHIGSSDMSEQLILANMYADMIEAKTDYEVKRDLSLGGVQICFSALQNKQIDMYIDYTGTLYLSLIHI